MHPDENARSGSKSTSARVLVVENDAGDPAQKLQNWLPGESFTLDIRRAHAGDSIPDAADYDAIIVLGGKVGAGDDREAPWLPRVRQVLADGVTTTTPVLGICLGAQLLASAQGGVVSTYETGGEIGVIEVDLTTDAADDPLAGALPQTYAAYSLHFDYVSELPRGAVRLASNDVCQNEMFRIGDVAWGVQSHPEATPEALMTWLEITEREHPELSPIDSTKVLEWHSRVDHDSRLLIEAFGDVVLNHHTRQRGASARSAP